MQLEISDGIARLTLDRAEKANAMDPALCASFRERTEELSAHDEVRVIVVASAAKVFSVGGDVGFMASQSDSEIEAAMNSLVGDLHAALAALAAHDSPVIAAVNGIAAGAGMSLVCGADLAVASERARFTMAYTGVGLSPDGGATWCLPRAVGQRRALELMLTNRTLDAREALELGLVNEVVAPEELEAAVDRLAVAIAEGPSGAHAAIGKLVRSSLTNTLEEQLEAERREIGRLAASAQGREGVTAFVEKRRPEFRLVSSKQRRLK